MNDAIKTVAGLDDVGITMNPATESVTYTSRDGVELTKFERAMARGSAVSNNWKGKGGYVESSPSQLRGWIGPARPQMFSDLVNVLPR